MCAFYQIAAPDFVDLCHRKVKEINKESRFLCQPYAAVL